MQFTNRFRFLTLPALLWLLVPGSGAVIAAEKSTFGDGQFLAQTSQPADKVAHKEAGKRAIQNHDLGTALNQLQTYVNLDTSDPEGHFWLAYALADSGKIDDAMREYQLAEEKQTFFGMDCAALRVNRGNLLLQSGKIAQAEAEYRQATTIDPAAMDAHLALAQILLMNDHVPEAFSELGECSATRGRDPRFCYLEAVANLKSGQINSAESWLRKCQVTSNQSQPPAQADIAIATEAQKLLQFLTAPH